MRQNRRLAQVTSAQPGPARPPSPAQPGRPARPAPAAHRPQLVEGSAEHRGEQDVGGQEDEELSKEGICGGRSTPHARHFIVTRRAPSCNAGVALAPNRRGGSPGQAGPRRQRRRRSTAGRERALRARPGPSAAEELTHDDGQEEEYEVQEELPGHCLEPNLCRGRGRGRGHFGAFWGKGWDKQAGGDVHFRRGSPALLVCV